MKRNILIAVIIAVMLCACAMYIFGIVRNDESPSENLLAFLAIEASLAASLVRMIKGEGGRGSLAFYERSYAEELGRAFESNPKIRKQLVAAARYYNENNYDRSLGLLQELRRECRNTHDKQAVMLFTALCYSDSGQTEAAIREYEQLLTENENNNFALGNLAILHMKNGKYQDAERLYQKALTLAPEEATCYHNLASFYYRVNDYDRAITLAEQALEKKQNLYQAASLLSILHAIRGDRETSRRYFEQAVTNGENAENLRATIDRKVSERREIERYAKALENTTQRFDSDIIITDPTYIVESDEDWKACEFGERLDLLGIKTYLTFDRGDCVGTSVINSDTDEFLGEFASDSCMVSIIALPELLAYRADALDKIDPDCYTIIRDFHGTVHARAVEDDDDQYWKFIGEGNINFESAPD